MLLLLFVACDSFEPEREGQITFETNEYYVLPGSSIIIDLKSVVKQSFTPVTLSVAQDPLRGTLTQLDPFLLKYTPNFDFIEGQDQFIMAAVLDDGTTLNSKPITVYMKNDEEEFPCGLYAVEDDIRIDPTSTAVIRVLKNDRICGVDEPVNVLVHLAPKFGEAVVVGDSIIYTPGPSFSKGDEFVYSLTTSNGKEVSFGLVSFNKSKFEVFEISLASSKIYFVDDMIGFIAGGSTIQKTVDGGQHWIQLTYPTSEDDYVTFEDIYFLGKDLGFAAFSGCSSAYQAACPGGWMMTKNGGESWNRTDLMYAVNSITFTSPRIGYMSTRQPDEWDGLKFNEVYKTVNAGETWDRVGYVDSNSDVNVKLRFATDGVGYAYEDERVSSTTDGGFTWDVIFNDFLTSFALASENVICVSSAAIGLSGTVPSAILRSENGFPFQVAINFPYTILSQGFSPEGDLGVAIGISGANSSVEPTSQILTISISTDTGKTWVDLAEHPDGFPLAISVPSSNVAYVLCSGKIIKYSP